MTIYTGSWPTGSEGSTGDTCGVIYDGRYYIGVKFDAGWKFTELGATSDMFDLKTLVTDGFKINNEYGTGIIYTSSNALVAKEDMYNKDKLYVVDNARYLDYAMSPENIFKFALIRNNEMDNTLDTTTGTSITVTAIDTTLHTITLSYIPYITSIDNPISGYEWALNRLDSYSATDPSRSGDYADQVLITSVDRTTSQISYDPVNIHGVDTDWAAGDKVAFYNPFIYGTGFTYQGEINDGTGIVDALDYVSPGPVFKTSTGTYIMLVNGSTTASGYKVYAYSSSDLVTWTVMNSGSAVFDVSGTASDWRESQIYVSGSVIDLHIDEHIVYASGYSGTDTKWRIGYILFNDDFTKIEYASGEIIDSSGSSAGLYSPSVIRYGSQWRMLYTDRDDNADPDSSTNPWTLKEATSSSALTTFVYARTVLTGRSTNDGVYWSSHADANLLFIHKGILYALVGATSRYSTSSTGGNRVYGLFSWNGSSWIEDNRNPIIINAFYGRNLWSSTIDGDDHLGGYPCFYINKDTGYLYLFVSGKNATSTGYFVMAFRKDISKEVI